MYAMKLSLVALMLLLAASTRGREILSEDRIFGKDQGNEEDFILSERAGETVCNLQVGDPVGGTEKNIGKAEDAEQCVTMVKKNEPLANGLSYGTNGKSCWAEFDATRIDPNLCKTCQSCLFSAATTSTATTTYTKLELKHCWDQRFGSFGTLEEAKSACTSDGNCAAIYDESCDNTGVFRLCPNGFTQDTSRSSCLYIKSETEQETKAPSLDRYNSAKESLKTVIDLDNLRPVLVRLAFHDCVGPNGCDGCLNLNNADNGGLKDIVTRLGEVRNGSEGTTFTDISNADFWQIAGIAALELASDNGIQPPIEFKGGRVDCPTSPSGVDFHEFPHPSMSRNDMMNWFKDITRGGFGMTENQVTALMGAHSLGGAKPENSGYKGEWTPQPESGPKTFNNDYYRRLLIPSWTFKKEEITSNKGTKFQWESSIGGSDKCMMLNTDVELVFDLNVDSNGEALCEPDMNSVNGCKVAATKAKVDEYFGRQDLFFKDFKEAYELMMTAKITAPLTVP